ncbi:hypothetical protein SAMN05216241_101541 [Limimonas halophila]|uniref:Uncharacterized protein n=2 Tax=Limimonas halophila TaxID=1082479 RepID=A0A1G7MC38_9PROT|nr:hypothetical protein SAMN05216241_101541 [Limimonas halophila]
MREAKDRFSARSWSERVYAPYREVLQSFRAVGQSLSLHALEEIAALGCTYEGVYAYDGEAGRELDPAAVAWPDEQKALAIEPDPIIIPMSPACIAPRPAPPAPTDPDAGRPLRPPDRKGAPASQLDLTVQHQWVQGYPVSEIRQFHASGLDAWTDDRLRACIANLYDAQ